MDKTHSVTLSRKAETDKLNEPVEFKTVKGAWENIDRVILKDPWMPAILMAQGSTSYRRLAGFIRAEMLVLDIDKGASIEEACDTLDEVSLRYIIAPTKNHQKPKSGSEARDRYRVLIPVNGAFATPTEYRMNAMLIGKHLKADSQCYDAAHFYWPSTRILHNTLFNEGRNSLTITPLDEDFLNSMEVSSLRYRQRFCMDKFDFWALPPATRTMITHGSLNQRNSDLLSLSCQLAMAGLGEEDILDLLHTMNSPFVDYENQVDWTRKEVVRTIENGARYGRKHREEFYKTNNQ